MVRNQLTPKCNRSNRFCFTITPPLVGFPSVQCELKADSLPVGVVRQAVIT